MSSFIFALTLLYSERVIDVMHCLGIMRFRLVRVKPLPDRFLLPFLGICLPVMMLTHSCHPCASWAKLTRNALLVLHSSPTLLLCVLSHALRPPHHDLQLRDRQAGSYWISLSLKKTMIPVSIRISLSPFAIWTERAPHCWNHYVAYPYLPTLAHA